MDKDYIDWIQDLKARIRSAQIKASIAVNEEMLMLYWDIGKSIVEKQKEFSWGSKIVEQMAKDLKRELPDVNGFSRTNLFSMRKFYLFYEDSKLVQQLGGQLENTSSNTRDELVHQLGGRLPKDSILCKIPWRHHVAILSQCKDIEQAFFYMQQTIQHNWSRNVLEIQIESNLIERQGKAINNFELTLPKPQSDLAKETLKDPFLRLAFLFANSMDFMRS